MSKVLSVRVEDTLVESLRARSEQVGRPASWLVSQALTLYLDVTPNPEPIAEPLPAPQRERPKPKALPESAPPAATAPTVKRPRCRLCGHGERLHSNTALSSGSGCVYMGCSCRRFVAGEA